MLSFLAGEVAAGHRVLPPPSNVLRAFRQPLADVRVLIVGQDPYPTPGHAVGLAFSVDGRTRPIPRSLANIYKELEADLGLPARVHGDLGALGRAGRPAAEQGPERPRGRCRLPPRKGLGDHHDGGRCRRRRPPHGRRRQAPARGRAVGKGRGRHPAAAGRHPRGGQRPSQPAVRLPRILRLPAVQPRQRPARRSRASAPWTGNFRPLTRSESGFAGLSGRLPRQTIGWPLSAWPAMRILLDAAISALHGPLVRRRAPERVLTVGPTAQLTGRPGRWPSIRRRPRGNSPGCRLRWP